MDIMILKISILSVSVILKKDLPRTRRMLRAIRFCCQLGFNMKNTYSAIIESSNLINKISSERIKMELDKILMSDYPQRLFIMEKTGLLKHIIPEFADSLYYKQNNPYHIYCRSAFFDGSKIYGKKIWFCVGQCFCMI